MLRDGLRCNASFLGLAASILLSTYNADASRSIPPTVRDEPRREPAFVSYVLASL